jgi:hypothetical protein
MGHQRQEGPLWRREASRMKYLRADIFYTPVAPVIPTVIFGQDHVIEGRPQLGASYPEEHLGLR